MNRATRLFVALAVTTLLVNSQIVPSTFHLVTRQQSHGFIEGGRVFSKVSSALSCARICKKWDKCTGFVWYPESKDCSVGQVDAISQTGSLPTPPGPALFFQRIVHCLTSLGYELRYTAGHTPMCLKYVGEKKTKPEADAVCASLHGSLVRANTQDKIELVCSVSLIYKDASDGFDSLYIFVEGSDEAEEGTFVWSDGLPFSEEELGHFLPNEPGGGASENFVGVSLHNPGFVDISENWQLSFVCEMRPF